ncbi:B12-binding domain-containing radical SAM protein [Inquilinus sp. OTU3971]|uniref:B12-binding domain-containing radical SAM protein n=1 Tax=Inquilinus sp. OTU3971 TaxID=3043855 RepID=UPI00313B29E7
MAVGTNGRRVFELVLIKPSHYDDDGYVIQWLRSAIPSNTLAVLYGLARDCSERLILGADVDIAITAIDETNTRVRPDAIIRRIRRAGSGMVALVGVQSNQFPRAVDIARPLRAAGIQVGIGGFHVSGTIAMLPGLQPEVAEAQALGISLFAGEAEGRLDEVLIDAFNNRLKPLYNFMDDLPNIEGVPMPVLPIARVRRTAGQHTSFDAGRGCPFQCSFCTIINVQGRKSRRRSPDDVEQIIRENVKSGISRFFITDDNFARNKDWEPIFDRLIELREREKLSFRMIIQVDTMCHRIPHFIEKAGRAGVTRVFIGLENINPDSLVGAKKRQNKITEYRKMLLAWKAVGAMTYAGYILGFPTDTPESIVRDIGIIQRELPVDLLEFFFLTPLPGSEDHKNLFHAGIPMDPDLNRYDLNHVTTGHALMSREEWQRAYKLAWQTYYSPEHMETVMRRAAATGISVGKILFLLLWFTTCINVEGLHPLEGGYLRRKVRTDRRPGLPIEAALPFYLRYAGETVAKHWAMARLWWRFNQVRRRIKADPNRKAYHDLALTPVSEEELDTLEMFSVTQGARAAAARAHTKPVPQPQGATAAE